MTLEAWAYLLGMAGTVLIAVPAFKAVHIVRLIRQSELHVHDIPEDQVMLKTWAKDFNTVLRDVKDAWDIKYAWCLFLGLFLTFMADLLKFVGKFVGH